MYVYISKYTIVKTYKLCISVKEKNLSYQTKFPIKFLIEIDNNSSILIAKIEFCLLNMRYQSLF